MALPKEKAQKTMRPTISSEAIDAMASSNSFVGKDVGAGKCAACSSGASSMSSSYVYALGRIEGRFPRPAIEKEFHQVAARTETKGKTDREVFHAVLSKRENR